MISLIAAMSNNRVIGNNNQLPWHLPNDLQHFKTLTVDKPIIMGRKTFDSIGRALPKRRNIVVSRQSGLTIPKCEVFTTIDDAISATQDEPETMIIGGATIYEQTIQYADRIYLTVVDTTIEGDAFFPKWSDDWRVTSEHAHKKDDEHAFDYTFLVLER
jgi:dihydrofolate reductase